MNNHMSADHFLTGVNVALAVEGDWCGIDFHDVFLSSVLPSHPHMKAFSFFFGV